MLKNKSSVIQNNRNIDVAWEKYNVAKAFYNYVSMLSILHYLVQVCGPNVCCLTVEEPEIANMENRKQLI